VRLDCTDSLETLISEGYSSHCIANIHDYSCSTFHGWFLERRKSLRLERGEWFGTKIGQRIQRLGVKAFAGGWGKSKTTGVDLGCRLGQGC